MKIESTILESGPGNLAAGKIRELQLKKFRKIFQWTYDHSKFHRKLYTMPA